MPDETPTQNQCGCGCSEPGGTASGEPGTANAPKTSCAALWSLICGIGSILCVPALPAVILGIIGLVNIKKSNGALTGSGKAITGIILGGLGIVLWPFILIVAAIAIPNILVAKDAADTAGTKARMKNIFTAIEMYYADTGNYPTEEQGLQILMNNNQGQKYLDNLPSDYWGREYHYRYPGAYNPSGYDLWSDGKDGIEGTGDDVTNWNY